MKPIAMLSCLLLSGCAVGPGPDSTEPPSVTAAGPSKASGVTTSAPAPAATPLDSARGPASSISNTWSGNPVDVRALPIGTSRVSTTAAGAGGLLMCDPGNPNGRGAQVVGPWVDEAAGTWDLSRKVSVLGSMSWPTARYDEIVDDTGRRITSNGLPLETVTGSFPVAPDDPAYAVDRNPNAIGEQAIVVTLPTDPQPAASPGCLPQGAVGVLRNGVVVFAPVDARGRDAVAYETQDVCGGHPEHSGEYHYHNVPACLLESSTGPSQVVGFAYDGFPIVVERDARGALPTNADLDACHGRTSPVALDGVTTAIYHYSATYEFPYFIGCFHGSSTVLAH